MGSTIICRKWRAWISPTCECAMQRRQLASSEGRVIVRPITWFTSPRACDILYCLFRWMLCESITFHTHANLLRRRVHYPLKTLKTVHPRDRDVIRSWVPTAQLLAIGILFADRYNARCVTVFLQTVTVRFLFFWVESVKISFLWLCSHCLLPASGMHELM